MSPLHVIETNDPLSDLIRFHISPTYEMLVSIPALFAPHRFTQWSEATREQLGKAFYNELKQFVEPYENGALFMELATGYPIDRHHDVLGFIDYVRQLSPVDFTFYLLGRAFTTEQIVATELKRDALLEMLENPPSHLWFGYPFSLDWLDDLPAFKNKMCDLWTTYWETVFQYQVEELRSHWMSGLHEKETFFGQKGGAALLKHVIGSDELPPEHPPGTPIQQIIFIPMFFTVQRVYLFYGFGGMTVLFDSQLSESRIAQINDARTTALRTLKAMGDENRLKILRLIVMSNGTMSGKKLAKKLNLSPSAISRHLSQLKDGNLISEHTEDNRTITYSLNRDVILSLPDAIMDYLYS